MVKKLFLGAFNVHRISALTCVFKIHLVLVDAGIIRLRPIIRRAESISINKWPKYQEQLRPGDIVPLRGVNLGSWLLMEGWMCPWTPPAWLIIIP